MKLYQKPNISNNWVCPICKKNDETPVCLVGIIGTEDGNIMEALQIHVDCIELSYLKNKDIEVLIQVISDIEKKVTIKYENR